EALGFEAVFISESYGDSLAYAEAVALATDHLRVGTAITNVYLRQPTLLAEQAAAVQEFSGGRLLLGLGVGHRAVNEPLGIDMGDPLGKMRAVIGTLRSAWTRGPHQPRPAIQPTVFAAALAERMIELAGELTDGPIFNLFPLARYPRALAALGRGAARVGRDPATLQVCHFTTCYLADDRAAALHEAKRMLARYANLPFYGKMLAASGFRAEVEAVRRWAETRVYERLLAANAGKPRFVLHDGPPYANGHIHLGTALNKVLKDIIVKHRAMTGRLAPYVPGWDCHGLPIELNVEKELGRAQKEALPKTEVRARCRPYADRFVAIQREEARAARHACPRASGTPSWRAAAAGTRGSTASSPSCSPTT